jgi:hypothetical protein
MLHGIETFIVNQNIAEFYCWCHFSVEEQWERSFFDYLSVIFSLTLAWL